MTVFNPSYLVKSRHGIWYFQIQIPLQFRKNKSRTLIRRSLRTRDRNIALSRSKFWYLKVVELKYDLSGFDNNQKRTSWSGGNQRLLSDCIDEFINEKKRGWKDINSHTNEYKDYRPKLSLLVEILGNPLVGQVTKTDIVKYKNSLFRMPSNRNKKSTYIRKSIDQLMEMDIPPEDLLSNTTIGNHFVKIASFLAWLHENDFLQSNLSSPLRRVIKKERPDSELRSAFTVSDLDALFNNDYYFLSRHHFNSHYWIPLLALFTGARLNELCQLDRADIVQIDGVWCIDVNDKNGKKLKNISSARLIPIHSKLINELSFIQFVESSEDIKLFPDLKASSVGYGQSFSKWFNRTYRKNCGVGQSSNVRKDFHSFRHTFANYFKQMDGVQEYRVSELLGHKSNSSITYGRYGKQTSIHSKKILIDSLSYTFIRFESFETKF